MALVSQGSIGRIWSLINPWGRGHETEFHWRVDRAYLYELLRGKEPLADIVLGLDEPADTALADALTTVAIQAGVDPARFIIRFLPVEASHREGVLRGGMRPGFDLLFALRLPMTATASLRANPARHLAFQRDAFVRWKALDYITQAEWAKRSFMDDWVAYMGDPEGRWPELSDGPVPLAESPSDGRA